MGKRHTAFFALCIPASPGVLGETNCLLEVWPHVASTLGIGGTALPTGLCYK